MTVDPKELAKWRQAHQNPLGQNIDVPEVALATVAPFPSLYASDFCVFLEASRVSPQVVDFVRAISREIAWVYDNWAKAQRDGNPTRLIGDMLNNATSVSGGGGVQVDYSQVRKFLVDYAAANGISLAGDALLPVWLEALGGDVTEVPAQPSRADAIATTPALDRRRHCRRQNQREDPMPFLTPQGAGYAFTIGYDGKIAEERDTVTCVRCQRVIHRRAGQRFEDVATLDPNSMKVMCARHAGEDDRRTFIQKVEPEEDRDAVLNVLRRLTI